MATAKPASPITAPDPTPVGATSHSVSHHITQFAVGAAAACGAVTFTNPWEVVKTRLQLQGELEKVVKLQGKTVHSAPHPYGNAVQAFVTIFKNEGLRGSQRGLAPAYVYQILLNGCRLGMYEPVKAAYIKVLNANHRGTPSVASLPAMVLAGATTGIMGAAISSPLYLVKTRMQSYTTSNAAAVGHQHGYITQGTVSALARIYKAEGIRGLWRGVDAACLRTGIGSAVQLSSYDSFKHLLSPYLSSTPLHLAASLGTSLLVCAAMNPFDVASTRMYNQHTATNGKQGALYRNAWDCIVKSVRAEGVGALYKGFSAHYLRIGPHTILTFVFLEQFRKLAKAWSLQV